MALVDEGIVVEEEALEVELDIELDDSSDVLETTLEVLDDDTAVEREAEDVADGEGTTRASIAIAVKNQYRHLENPLDILRNLNPQSAFSLAPAPLFLSLRWQIPAPLPPT